MCVFIEVRMCFSFCAYLIHPLWLVYN